MEKTDEKKFIKFAFYFGFAMDVLFLILTLKDFKTPMNSIGIFIWDYIGIIGFTLITITMIFVWLKWKITDYVRWVKSELQSKVPMTLFEQNKKFAEVDLKTLANKVETELKNMVEGDRFDATIKGIIDTVRDMSNKLDKISR